jgi:hypothetical protein
MELILMFTMLKEIIQFIFLQLQMQEIVAAFWQLEVSKKFSKAIRLNQKFK